MGFKLTTQSIVQFNLMIIHKAVMIPEIIFVLWYVRHEFRFRIVVIKHKLSLNDLSIRV